MHLNSKLLFNTLLVSSAIFVLSFPDLLSAQDKSKDSKSESKDTEEELVDYRIYKDKDVFNLDGSGSMMFDKESLMKLYKLLKKARARNIYEDYPDLKEINKQKEATRKDIKIIPNSRNFFLDSILYYNSKNWSIWINKSKTTSSSIQDNPKITYVSKKNVIAVWQNLDINETSPDWKSTVQHIEGTPEATEIVDDKEKTEEELEEIKALRKKNFEDGTYLFNYISKDGNVKIDSENRIIEFNLRLHQTFIGHKLSLAEGFVKNDQRVDQNMLNNESNTGTVNSKNINQIKQAIENSGGEVPDPNNTEFDSLVNDIFNDPNL